MKPLENMDEMLPDFLKKTGPAPDGFRLPDGYFETFGDRFRSPSHDPSPEGRGEPQEALTTASDEGMWLLSLLPPSGGPGGDFNLPDGYFKNLPDRVFEKLKTGGKTLELPQTRPFFKILKNPAALAAAASMAVLVAALAFFFQKETVETPAPIACNAACLSEKISAEDVQDYLSENLSEFSTDELAAEDLVGEIAAPTLKKHQEIDLNADDAEPLLKEMLDDVSEKDLEDML